MTEAFGPFLEQKIEPVPVGIIEKDILLRVPTQDYMIVCAGIVDAGFSCHERTIDQKSNNASLTPVFPVRSHASANLLNLPGQRRASGSRRSTSSTHVTSTVIAEN